LSPDQPEDCIGELLRTLMTYAKYDIHWSDHIQLSCKCGWRGRQEVRNLTEYEWDCPDCQRKIAVSPVTFEPVPQEP
jgi:hypothetical protein